MSLPASPAHASYGGNGTKSTVSTNGTPNGEAKPTGEVKPDEMELLRKLDEANRLLECDRKSLQSLSPRHQPRGLAHSRQGSVSSTMSNASISSTISNNNEEISDSPEELWNIWGKIVTDWETIAKKKPNYIKELVRKGVPHHFRGIVWQLLCSAHNSAAKEQYAELLKMPSPSEKLIRRDITRTYPDHEFFKEKNGLGQESLFNVMKAYSLVDREVGYCQGSAFIVGLLLMQMPEEEAFAVMVKVMQEYRLRELFKPSMAELGLCMFQFECMIQDQLPQLYSHFQTQSFCVSMFASSWFLTLFTTSLPLGVACRVFDVFLSEGMEMIFKFGFAILETYQKELMMMDMEGMLKYFQKQMPHTVELDQQQMFACAYQVKYNAKKMKKLEKEYNALKTKEQEEQVELRRLRTENRLLRQRIDNLEKETATLADRLIHDQVKNAQQEEEVYALKRDLSVARQHSEDAEKKLAETNAKLLRRSNSTSSTSSAGDGTGESDAEKVAKLTKQLADLRHWENESKACIRQLREKIREMEQENRQLQKDPKDEIAQFQEELIACKLREAEGNLSLKELQQKVIELDRHWQKYTEKQAAQNATPNSKVSKTELKNLQDECMALRIKEAQSVSELKEMKQKVMELETQNHICERHNKRLEEETAKLKEQLDEGDQRDKDLQQHIKELERKIEGSENKHKEEQMMLRIKDAEHSQLIAEMRQRIAELEIENQELVTAGQLQNKEGNESLTAKISELQDQVVQLKMARRLQSLSSMAMSTMSIGDTESDNESDLEATLHKHALKLTDSLSLTTGMTLEDIAQASMALPPGPPPADDSTDSEDIGNGEVIRKKVIQRKKRKNHKDGDFDKTPTQDSVEMPFSLVKNGITNIDLNQTHGDQSKHKGLSSTTSEVESSTTSNAMDCVSSNLSTPSRKGTEHDCVSEPVDL